MPLINNIAKHGFIGKGTVLELSLLHNPSERINTVFQSSQAELLQLENLEKVMLNGRRLYYSRVL